MEVKADSRLVIVGAGISGLSLAYFCARSGLKAHVLEATETPGGCIQTLRHESGFWVEMGAHTCYNSYGALLSILEERPGLTRILSRRAVPFRVLVDGQIKPIARELRFGELLASAPRIFFTRKRGLSVEEYYSRVVGRRNWAHLFSPIFSAVPSQRADAFPAEMLLKKRPRRKDLPKSFTLQGGLQSAIEAMASQPGVTVESGAPAERVERRGSGFQVVLRDGTTRPADAVGLAVPPQEAARLLKAALPAAATALGRIAECPVESLALALPRDKVPVEPFAGVIPLDGRFFSVVSRDVLPDERYRGFAFHFGPGQPLEDKKLRAAELLKLTPALLGPARERRVLLPSPTTAHPGIVEAIDRALPHSGLFITGNYFGGLAIEDCVLRSRSESQRLLAERL